MLRLPYFCSGLSLYKWATQSFGGSKVWNVSYFYIICWGNSIDIQLSLYFLWSSVLLYVCVHLFVFVFCPVFDFCPLFVFVFCPVIVFVFCSVFVFWPVFVFFRMFVFVCLCLSFVLRVCVWCLLFLVWRWKTDEAFLRNM